MTAASTARSKRDQPSGRRSRSLIGSVRGQRWRVMAPLIVLTVENSYTRVGLSRYPSGLAVFEMIRWRHYDHAVTLCAFDLLELDRTDIPGNPSRKGSAYWRSPSVAHIGAMPSQHRLKQIVQSIPIGGFQVLPNFATLLIATSNSDRKPINPPSLSF